MSIGKINIACFVSGLLIGFISTWHNRYGEIELWDFQHHISMAISTFVVALLFRISSTFNYQIIGFYISAGVIFIQIIAIALAVTSGGQTILSLSTLIYTVVALSSSFMGSYIGEFLLKDDYKKIE